MFNRIGQQRNTCSRCLLRTRSIPTTVTGPMPLTGLLPPITSQARRRPARSLAWHKKVYAVLSYKIDSCLSLIFNKFQIILLRNGMDKAQAAIKLGTHFRPGNSERRMHLAPQRKLSSPGYR